MPTTRRELLQSMARGCGSLALAPFALDMRAQASGDPNQLPKRFVFVTRSNGLLPYGIQPAGLEGRVNGPANKIVRSKEMTALPLPNYELHPTMAALQPFRSRLNIIQGVSAKVCSGNHSAHYGALGNYPVGGGGPRAETIDAKLARAFPGIFPHIGLMLGAKGRKVLNPKLSAAGPSKPLSYYADPILAYQDLFGAVATGGGNMAARAKLDGNLLDFMVGDIKRMHAKLPASEREKLSHYLAGFESLRDRRTKIAKLGKVIEKGAPAVSDKYASEVETHRLEAHFDMAAAALITGLTRVIAISCDKLETRYSGLGLGDVTVHHLGHLEVKGNTGNARESAWTGEEGVNKGRASRDKVRKFHLDLIGGLARKLDAVPEGDGTMLDNTVIVFFAESGDRHHPSFFTWPMVTLGSLGGTLKTGRYLQYPNHGAAGHATLGNFYTTLLHAAGMPQKGFGNRDVRLGTDIDQTAPLSHLLT